MKNRVIVTVMSLLSLSGTAAMAQTARAIVPDTPVRAAAQLASPVIATLNEGGAVDVVDVQGDWCRVLLPEVDGKPRVGYVSSRLIEFGVAGESARVASSTRSVSAPAASLRASIAPSAEQVATPRAIRINPTPAYQPAATAGEEQVDTRASNRVVPFAELVAAPDRGWIDVGVAKFRSEQKAQTFVYETVISREPAAFAAAYPAIPAYTDLDLSGGFRIRGGLGLSLHFDGSTYKGTVGLGATVPDPFRFNNSATDGSVTESTLERREFALDMGAVYSVPVSNRFAVRVFGGPTYFHATNEMISNIGYRQVAGLFIPVNVIAISSYEQQQVEGSSLGFHVGGDASVFFTRFVGVGGGVRFNRGTVTVREPLSGDNGDLQMGHLQFGGGLRLRF